MSVTPLDRPLARPGRRGGDRLDRAVVGRAVAHDAPAWVVLGCLGLAVLAVVFYTRLQHIPRARTRLLLALFRAAVLVLLFLMLAEPVLTVRVTSRLRPTLWLLFDGTDSMAIADQLPDAERARLAEAVGLPQAEGNASAAVGAQPSRVDFVKALFNKKNDNLLARLGKKARLRAFLFDRPDGVRALEAATGGDDRLDPGTPVRRVDHQVPGHCVGRGPGGPRPAADAPATSRGW